MKSIRKFVTFNFDLRKELTAAQKKKIKKYFDEYSQLTARPFHVFKTTDKKKLAKAKDFSGQDKKLKEFKAAFIPTAGEEKVKVKFDKSGKMRVSTKYVSTEIIELDAEDLATDPVKHVKQQIKGSSSTAYTIMAGKHEIPTPVSKSRIGERVGKLVMKYSDDSKNNYFGNWLFGLHGHVFTNQADIKDYMRAKSAAKEKLRRDRKNQKRRLKRKRK